MLDERQLAGPKGSDPGVEIDDLIRHVFRSLRVLDDLADRGLSEKILLVITGEFGRTPRINNDAGRDHWAPLSTLALAGGGLRMGQVIGATDAHGSRSRGNPHGPQHVLATMYHVLGIDPSLQFNDHNGRPQYLLEERTRIAGLL